MPVAREVALALDARTGALLLEDTRGLPRDVREALEQLAGAPCVRLAGYWHDSLIEGPGRRSVAKLQGCPIRCRGFIPSMR